MKLPGVQTHGREAKAENTLSELQILFARGFSSGPKSLH